jgi:Peptidase family M23
MTTRRRPLANKRRTITVLLCAVLATVTATACGRGALASEPEATPVSDPAPDQQPPVSAELTPVIQAVPTPPRWYRGTDGGVHLQYEVLLTNTLPIPVDVVSVQVRGDDHAIDTLAGDRLVAALSPLGSERGSSTTLPAATVGVVWVDLTVSSAEAVPESVSQEVTVDVGPGLPVGPRLTSVGGRAAVAPDEPVIIQAPLPAGRWVAAAGAEGPHRRALQAVGGQLWLSQRFAVDFAARLDDDGRSRAGDPAESASYFNYGEKVLAVGSGTVLEAVDRLPDQIPNHPVPLSIAQADGNHVILKLAEGVYAGYAHLQPGSVRVQVGDHVEGGQIIGLLGNSGSSTGPHLHFQLMNRPSIAAADGLPFAYDDFTYDGAVTSLEEFLQADLDGTPVPIDPSGAGPRRHESGTGIDVLSFPADDRSDAERRPRVDGNHIK